MEESTGDSRECNFETKSLESLEDNLGLPGKQQEPAGANAASNDKDGQVKMCTNSGSASTPLWRKDALNPSLHNCNTCRVYFDANQRVQPIMPKTQDPYDLTRGQDDDDAKENMSESVPEKAEQSFAQQPEKEEEQTIPRECELDSISASSLSSSEDDIETDFAGDEDDASKMNYCIKQRISRYLGNRSGKQQQEQPQ